jgi:hypothetical protein
MALRRKGAAPPAQITELVPFCRRLASLLRGAAARMSLPLNRVSSLTPSPAADNVTIID